MRDRLAIALANWILRHVATTRTATFIAGAIEYGMSAAARDARLGYASPTPWRMVTTDTGTITFGAAYRSVP